MRRSILLVGLLAGYVVQVLGQDPIPLPYDRDPIRAIPRAEDHFWRKKVMSRIDLTEKVNKPLVYHEPNLYTRGTDHFGNVDGMVYALVAGFRDGKYIGYNPDTLTKEITYDQFVAHLMRFKAKEEGGEEGGEGDEEEGQSDIGGDEFGFGDDFGGFDDFGGDFGDFGADEETATTEQQDQLPQKEAKIDEEIMAGMETVIELIEDWIFDKNRSAMFYNTQYIRLIYVDPTGAIPDEAVIAFRYQDVMDILDDTKYRNRFNDAEHRSVREAIELRRFNSYIIDLSGDQPQSLIESDYRRNQILEFEHHLWSY